MKRNLIAVVLFGVASVQAGVAWTGPPQGNGIGVNGINLANGQNRNGISLQAERLNERSLERIPSSTVGSENVAARPTYECITEPERCAVDSPRLHALAAVQSVTLPDGSTYAVR